MDVSSSIECDGGDEMTRFTGTAYEGKARKELASRGIFSVGLQPDASPDLILPAFKIGLEIKSTRSTKYYPSKHPDQYQYLKNQFAMDWPGFLPFFLIYFITIHAWRAFPIPSISPCKDAEGIPMDDFIHIIVSQSQIDFNEIEGVIE